MVKINDLVYYDGEFGKVNKIVNGEVQEIKREKSTVSFCGSASNRKVLLVKGEVVDCDYSERIKKGDTFKLLDITYSLNEIKDSWQMKRYEDLFNVKLVVKEVRDDSLIYDFTNKTEEHNYVLEFKKNPILELLNNDVNYNVNLNYEQIQLLRKNGFEIDVEKVMVNNG